MNKQERLMSHFYTKLTAQNQKVDLYFSQGKFHKCIQLLNKLLQETRKKKSKVHEGLTALKLADMYVKVYDYDQAIIYYKKGLKCLDQPGGPMTKTVGEVYKGLFHCYLALQQHDDIIKYGMMACEYQGLKDEEKAKITQQMADSHLKLFQEQGIMVYLIRGLTYAKEAITYYRRTDQTEGPDYVHSLFICGDLYFHLREYDEALKHLEEAYQQSGVAEISRQLLSQICFLLYKMYSIQGDDVKAIRYKNECLQL